VISSRDALTYNFRQFQNFGLVIPGQLHRCFDVMLWDVMTIRVSKNEKDARPLRPYLLKGKSLRVFGISIKTNHFAISQEMSGRGRGAEGMKKMKASKRMLRAERNGDRDQTNFLKEVAGGRQETWLKYSSNFILNLHLPPIVPQKFLTDLLQYLRQIDRCQHRYSKMTYRICYNIRAECVTAYETMRCPMTLPQVKHGDERFSKELSLIRNGVENPDQLPALLEEYKKKKDIPSCQAFHYQGGSFVPYTISVDAMAVEQDEEKPSKILMKTLKAKLPVPGHQRVKEAVATATKGTQCEVAPGSFPSQCCYLC
jgi:hypothetical protein